MPTQYGIQDACALLDCDYQWTGSTDADVAQMVNTINAAIATKASAIAVPIVAPMHSTPRCSGRWMPAFRCSRRAADRLRPRGGEIAIIMHNYPQTLDIADCIVLMQHGQITYERDTAATSVEELMDIVRREYRAMRASP